MRPAAQRASRRKGGPPPVEAGTNLLVHDLKNLAGRLATLCQNLAERYEDPFFKDTAMDLLDDTALHLKRLAEELRDHEGRVLIKLRVDLNGILEEAVRDARPDPHVYVIQRYADIPTIWGDVFLLRRAFACAIENGLEAMKGRGTLGVQTAVTRRRGSVVVVVEISDTGHGMSEEFLREYLFRPFTSTKEDGLGLGVYTIRQVVQLHGGSLRILSAENLGTRVRFRFPAGEG